MSNILAGIQNAIATIKQAQSRISLGRPTAPTNTIGSTGYYGVYHEMPGMEATPMAEIDRPPTTNNPIFQDAPGREIIPMAEVDMPYREPNSGSNESTNNYPGYGSSNSDDNDSVINYPGYGLSNSDDNDSVNNYPGYGSSNSETVTTIQRDDNFRTPGGMPPEFYNEEERFQNFVENQGVERTANEDFRTEVIADSWDDIPEEIRDREPGNLWGNFVDDRGHHIENTRLPGGYHIAVDDPEGPVILHHDAHDPLNGPAATFQHWNQEVRQIENGNLDVPQNPSDDNPNWPEYRDTIYSTSVNEDTGVITRTEHNPINNTGTVTVSTPDTNAASSPITNVSTFYDENGNATSTTTVTSPTGGTYGPSNPDTSGDTSHADEKPVETTTNQNSGDNHPLHTQEPSSSDTNNSRQPDDHKSSADEREEQSNNTNNNNSNDNDKEVDHTDGGNHPLH